MANQLYTKVIGNSFFVRKKLQKISKRILKQGLIEMLDWMNKAEFKGVKIFLRKAFRAIFASF